MGKDNYISFHFGCPPPRTTSSSKLVFHLKSSSLELGWKQRKTHHHPNSFWLQCNWPAAERLSSFIKWHTHIFTHKFTQLPALGVYIDIHCGQSNPNPNLNLTSIHTPPLTSAGTSELMFCCISTSLWSPWGLLVPTKTQTHTQRKSVVSHHTGDGVITTPAAGLQDKQELEACLLMRKHFEHITKKYRQERKQSAVHGGSYAVRIHSKHRKSPRQWRQRSIHYEYIKAKTNTDGNTQSNIGKACMSYSERDS